MLGWAEIAVFILVTALCLWSERREPTSGPYASGALCALAIDFTWQGWTWLADGARRPMRIRHLFGEPIDTGLVGLDRAIVTLWGFPLMFLWIVIALFVAWALQAEHYRKLRS